MVAFTAVSITIGASLLFGATVVKAQSVIPTHYMCPPMDNFPSILCHEDDISSAPGNSHVITCYYSNDPSNNAGYPNQGANGCPAGQRGSDGSDAELGPNGQSAYYCTYSKTTGALVTDNDAGGKCMATAPRRSSRMRSRRSVSVDAPPAMRGSRSLRKRVDYFRQFDIMKETVCTDQSDFVLAHPETKSFHECFGVFE